MMRKDGVTLVELLVAMALIGVVLTGIFGIVVGTMRFSTASQGTSDRLRELTNATGYVVDQVRGARSAVSCGAECVELDVADVQGLALTGSSHSVQYAILARSDVDPSWLERGDGGERVLVERRGEDSYLVLDRLANDSSIDIAGGSVALAFQVRHTTRAGALLAPKNGPHLVEITPRNRP